MARVRDNSLLDDSVFYVQIQSGSGFPKKSMFIRYDGVEVFIPLSKSKVKEILEVFPSIAQEG